VRVRRVAKRRYKCIVCGRVFPEGQGIIIKFDGMELAFHSNRCASKFFRELLERIPPDTIKGYVKRLVEEYEENLKETMEKKAKKI
jgi:large subunit ribosomal protein L24e